VTREALAALERSIPAEHGEAPPRALRPRDAGTLIVVDRSGAEPRILMGRRAAGHVFMPGRYVFPGGRVETGDLALARRHPLGADVLARLTGRTTARFGERQACALALAAIRETFEEVGLRVGAPGAAERGCGASWTSFCETGLLPDPARLVPVARAITPPAAVRRYDTRFFAIEGSAQEIATRFADRPSDELDAVDWFTFAQIETLSLAEITRRILADFRERLADASWRDASVPIPFYRAERGRFRRDLV
jgi:8-oxo-dGTP pyrophosphatase MutT (NUDIX family)